MRRPPPRATCCRPSWPSAGRRASWATGRATCRRWAGLAGLVWVQVSVWVGVKVPTHRCGMPPAQQRCVPDPALNLLRCLRHACRRCCAWCPTPRRSSTATRCSRSCSRTTWVPGGGVWEGWIATELACSHRMHSEAAGVTCWLLCHRLGGHDRHADGLVSQSLVPQEGHLSLQRRLLAGACAGMAATLVSCGVPSRCKWQCATGIRGCEVVQASRG